MNDETDNDEIAEPEEGRAFASIFRAGLTRQQAGFLQAYLCTGSVRSASKVLKLTRWRHYEWMKEALYVECFREAQTQTAIALEEEARRRAVDGVLEPVFGKDDTVIGHRRKYSDSLLVRLLEANAPEKFGRHVDHGPPPPNVKVLLVDNGRGDSSLPRVVLPKKDPPPQ